VGAIAAAAAVALASMALLPLSAGLAQQEDPKQRQDEVREEKAELEHEVEALEGKEKETRQKMADLETQLADQQAELDEAERAAKAAEQAVADATKAVADAEKRIDDLERETDEVVIEAFVNPPIVNGLDIFDSGSMSEAAIKQELLRLQSDTDADAFDKLEAAREDLEIEKANKEAAADEAEAKRQAADAALADLKATFAEQQDVVAKVEADIDRRLAEVETLKELDAELSRQIEAEAAEWARRVQRLADAQAAAEAASGVSPPPPPAPTGGSTIQPVSGGLASVTCPGGGSITVAGSIAQNVQGLLDAAAANGLFLCGGGYRNPEEQIALRQAHCGTSQYAIYEMPSSQCSPPTARPGSSMHEQGLAIDFTCGGGGIVSSGDPCFQWLAANAATYGLFNLPSEPWHWSTNGS
jgi:peptidoglycan hydrolase CwlO-like protein